MTILVFDIVALPFNEYISIETKQHILKEPKIYTFGRKLHV